MSNTGDYFGGGGSYKPEIDAAIQRLEQFNAQLVGAEINLPPSVAAVQSSLIPKRGGTYSIAAYPLLAAWLDNHPEIVTTMAGYNSIVSASPINACSKYGMDNGGSTFRVPTVGNGGFARSLGTSGVTVGTIDGGFDYQIENIIGHFGLNIYDSYEQDVTGPFDAYIGRGDGGAYIGGGGTYTMGFDASKAVNAGTETTPQGSYIGTYIYSGNIVSNLPTPEPDWLTQQQANTDAIAALNAPVYPTPWADGSQYLFAGHSTNANEFKVQWTDANTFHCMGIVRGSRGNGNSVITLPRATASGTQYKPVILNSIAPAYLQVPSSGTIVSISAAFTSWIMVDVTFVLSPA